MDTDGKKEQEPCLASYAVLDAFVISLNLRVYGNPSAGAMRHV
jgi:hypothetical protein